MSASSIMLGHRYAFTNDSRYGANIGASEGRIGSPGLLQREEMFGASIGASEGRIGSPGLLQREEMFGGRGRGQRSRRSQMVRGPTHGGHRGGGSSTGSTIVLSGSLKSQLSRWRDAIKSGGKLPRAAKAWLKKNGLPSATPAKALKQINFLLSGGAVYGDLSPSAIQSMNADSRERRTQDLALGADVIEFLGELPYVISQSRNSQGVITATLVDRDSNGWRLQEALSEQFSPDTAAVFDEYDSRNGVIIYVNKARAQRYPAFGAAPLPWTVETEPSRMGGTRLELYDNTETLRAVMEVDAQGNVTRSYGLTAGPLEERDKNLLDIYRSGMDFDDDDDDDDFPTFGGLGEAIYAGVAEALG